MSMIRQKITDGLPYLQSDRLLRLGVSHGWFGVALGDTMPKDDIVKQRWARACSVLGVDSLKLVQTTGISQSSTSLWINDEAAGGIVGPADGFVTKTQGMPLWLRAADCMQMVIYDPVPKVMAVVHAGGKGVAGDVLSNTLELMADHQAEPSRMIVGIGPAIGPEHFIPTREVDGFTLDDIEGIAPVSVELSDGRKGYDIVATACSRLAELGVLSSNIETSGIDTYADTGFYSYERDRIHAPAEATYRNGFFVQIDIT